MTEGNETGGNNAIDNASTTITSQIASGQLFGPFPDPLQWLALKSTSSVCANNSIASNCNDLFANVNISRDSHEQNMEIIHKDGQFYFKAMYNMNDNNSAAEKSQFPKLYAWFSKELSEKLPPPSSSTINGTKRYYCVLCNEVFMYPNPVVVHLLFTCPKRNQIAINNSTESNQIEKLTTTTSTTLQHPILSFENSFENSCQNSCQNSKPKQPTTKKRGFDIASLVREESNEDSQTNNKLARNELETNIKVGEDVDVHSCSSHITSGLSAFHRPKSPHSMRHQTLSLSEPTINSVSTSSAFKKVENQKINQIPYDFSVLYHRVATSSLIPPPATPQPTLISPSLTTITPTTIQTTMSSPVSGTKSLVSNTLLPYLPPSLAALTFPTSNWCAKCNATFRMTSDLVYHMRSHHKNSMSVDPLKKKREEKLRCNICHETFRERHHLTRHMTSHQ